MKTYGLFFVILLIFFGCNSQKQTIDLEKEKQAVLQTIKDFNKYYEQKDIEGIKKLISRDGVHIFGSDVSERMQSYDEVINQLQQDWKIFDSINYGPELRNYSSQISLDATLASALYDFEMNSKIGSTNNHLEFRVAYVLKKEDNRWKFIEGLFSLPTKGQSSVDMGKDLRK